MDNFGESLLARNPPSQPKRGSEGKSSRSPAYKFVTGRKPRGVEEETQKNAWTSKNPERGGERGCAGAQKNVTEVTRGTSRKRKGEDEARNRDLGV